MIDPDQSNSIELEKSRVPDDGWKELRLVNVDEVKPTSQALDVVGEVMASVYNCLPVRFEDDVLTVVIGDPDNGEAIANDLRNLLGLRRVNTVVADANAIKAAIARHYCDDI